MSRTSVPVLTPSKPPRGRGSHRGGGGEPNSELTTECGVEKSSVLWSSELAYEGVLNRVTATVLSISELQKEIA